MNAFKLKQIVKVDPSGKLDPIAGQPTALRDLPDAAKRIAVFAQIKTALSIPLKLAHEFKHHALAKGLLDRHQAVSAPSFDQLKSFAHREFFGGHAKYATPDANPILTTATGLLEAWFHELTYFDFNYLRSFDRINLIGSNQDSFKINTTSAGITWAQRNPGEPTPIRREFAEGEQTVSFLKFTAGFGILDEWLQFNQFYRIEELVNEFINASYVKRASLHYALFTATSNEEAFATDDATTFNNAISTMIQATKNKGYGNGANPVVDLYVDTKRAGRVLAMLEATRGSLIVAYGTQDQPIAVSPRSVNVCPDLSTSGTGYYAVMAGGKLKTADWKALTIESQRDISVGAIDWVGTEQYNAVAGDANQIIRVKFS